MRNRSLLPSLVAAALYLAWAPAPGAAQDVAAARAVTAHAGDLVEAIGELATRDVAGAICADINHREARVLMLAMREREARLRAAIARHDRTAERAERAVIEGLFARIEALHAEAASCVGETVSEPARAPVEPRFSCVVEVSPRVPRDAVRPPEPERPRSAMRE